MVIDTAYSNFEIEPLVRPFGFKGGALTNLWQYSVFLQTRCGRTATGLGNQNTLWSDADVFAENSQAASAAMMYLITEYAVRLLRGREVLSPPDTIDEILPQVLDYARQVTGRPNLRTTFALNALVGVDHALWKLFERQTGGGFDGIVPPRVRGAFSHRYGRIGVIPLISYHVNRQEIRRLAQEGFFLLKIKIGSDPDRDGDRAKMLEWDKQRIRAVHEAVKDIPTPCTDSGQIAYYLDANGRYDNVERLAQLLEYAREIGALERTVLVEEPFPEEYKASVRELPALIAADESAHSPADVAERIALGYGAIALKPIAKTMSVTFRMIEEAAKNNIPCFCADLTVGPLLAEINKTFAARMAPLPGLRLPVFESNGWQNYTNWDRMVSYNPVADRAWTRLDQGGYTLDDSFYELSGGMFMDYPHYRALALEGEGEMKRSERT